MSRRAILAVAAIILMSAAHRHARGQNLPVVGATSSLDVGTWNLQFLGNDGDARDDNTQIQNASEVIRQSGIDLWSIQEIDDEGDFQRLVDGLGDAWHGELDQESSNLRVGFIFRTDVINVRRISAVLTQYRNEFAGRPPLQMEADVTLPDTSFSAVFIALHMKCCSDSWSRREEASRRLKTHVDIFFPGEPVFVLGDFNDELTRSISSGKPTPYENFLGDETHYFFTTLAIEQNGGNTHCSSSSCSSGSVLDHILITDELFDTYVSGSAETYDAVLDPQTGIEAYRSTTSDHLPVYARFEFKTNTNTEAMPRDRPLTLYPNPARGGATLEYEAPAAGDVSIRLYDLLGRELRTWTQGFLPAGEHRITLDAADLAPGRYIIRLQTGGRSYVKSFSVVR